MTKLKAPKEKKAAPRHPSYFQMIQEAITTIKNKGGLSTYAITKFIEAKYKSVLHVNFKVTLRVQLRICVSRGKLVQVKRSFKLSEASKKVKKVATKKVAKKVIKKVVKKVRAKKAAGKKVKETKKRKRPASGARAPRKKPKKVTKKVIKKVAKKVKKATPAAKRARKVPR